jgi:dihydroorotase-like cyclic amidohydrolase
MSIRKHTIDRALTIVAATASAVLPGLVDQHVITAGLATTIGAGLTAALGAYHGGAAVQRNRTDPAVPIID